MNEKNLEFLKDALKYLGFDQRLNEDLIENVKSRKPTFQLAALHAYRRDTVTYILDFKKSDKADLYFFNQYTATLRAGESGQERTQTFYINKNAGITANRLTIY